MVKEVKLVIFAVEGTLLSAEKIDFSDKNTLTVNSLMRLKISSLFKREDIRVALATKYNLEQQHKRKQFEEFIASIFNCQSVEELKNKISVINFGDFIKPLTILCELEPEEIKVVATVVVTTNNFICDPLQEGALERKEVVIIKNHLELEQKKIDQVLEKIDKALEKDENWLRYSWSSSDEVCNNDLMFNLANKLSSSLTIPRDETHDQQTSNENTCQIASDNFSTLGMQDEDENSTETTMYQIPLLNSQ